MRKSPSTSRMVVYGIVAMIFLGYSCWSFRGACNDIICMINCPGEVCCDENGNCEALCNESCNSESTFNIGIAQARAGNDIGTGQVEEVLQGMTALKSDGNLNDQKDDNAKEEAGVRNGPIEVEDIVIKIFNGLVSLIGFILVVAIYKLPRDGNHPMSEATS